MNDTHTPIRRVPLTRSRARYTSSYSVVFDILLVIAIIATWALFFGLPFVNNAHLLDIHYAVNYIRYITQKG